MRKAFVVVLFIGVMTSFSACGNGIDSQVQSVSSNKQIVSKEVEEDPCKNGHIWVEATCETPKTCSVCGKTEGKALGHDWSFATLEKPKTCKNCGATVGEPVICKEVNLDFTKTYSSCTLYKNEILCGRLNDNPDGAAVTLDIYDYDCNLIKSIESENYTERGASWGSTKDFIWYRVGYDFTYFDLEGNQVGKFHFDYSDVPKCDNITTVYNEDSTILKMGIIDNNGKDVKDFYIDTMKMTEVDIDPSEFTELTWERDFDKNKYSECIFSGVPGLYLVANPDKTEWGYVDEKFNELAMYKDATGFNSYGYAFVTSDGTSYDIIDSDFNIIAKNYAIGKTAGNYLINDIPSPIIAVEAEDGYKYFHIKYDDPEMEPTGERESVVNPTEEQDASAEDSGVPIEQITPMDALLDSNMGKYISNEIFDGVRFGEDTSASDVRIGSYSLTFEYGDWFIQIGNESNLPDIGYVVVGSGSIVNDDCACKYSYLFPSGSDIHIADVDGSDGIHVPVECIIHLQDIFDLISKNGIDVAPNAVGTDFKPCDPMDETIQY